MRRFTFIVRMIQICCVVVLLFCGSASAYKLPDTGQTKCYDVVAGDEIACAGTGQDGAYTINPMSFTDNGNGTITDNNTGLVWQKQDEGTTRTWDVANSYCNNLVLGGASDWRLPTKKELMSIVDYGIPAPGPTINTTYFPNASAGSTYWSTTVSYKPSNAWSVRFGDGFVSSYYLKGSPDYYVRCVRSGQDTGIFVDNGNGTVTDNKTGLMWQQGEGGSMSWDKAISYCEGLTLGGNSDWRLPNSKELESLTDDTRYSPAIDTAFFPNAHASVHWSSTTVSEHEVGAWSVLFGYGDVVIYDKVNYSYVRCVRGGQSGSSTNNCAATLGNDLSIHLPIVTFGGTAYWADFAYVPNTMNFNITDAGIVADVSPYAGCAQATLSQTLNIHAPTILYGDMSLWADFQYSGDTIFTVTNAGLN